MSFWSWVRRIKDGRRIEKGVTTDDDGFTSVIADYYIRELCLMSAVNLIAKLVSKCEFKTFLRGEEVHDAEWYLWNVEPNVNQNSTAFLQKLITTLYLKNECLVVEVDGKLLVADGFQKKTFALYDYQFSGVTVDDFTFQRPFLMRDVLYFRLGENNMRLLINGVYESYKQMLEYAEKQYVRSRGSRGVLTISGNPRNDPEFKTALDDLLQNKFKAFFTANNAVLPLFNGYKYEDIGSKTYSSETTRDIRAMIDDISDLSARALGIPPALMRGDVAGTSDAMDSLLTVTLDPLCDMLQEEINRKRNGIEGLRAGTWMQIDTKCIKHVDLLSVATSIDKLIGSGAYCVNDILKLTGDRPIDEPWANEHYMTKNYGLAADVATALGGEKNA